MSEGNRYGVPEDVLTNLVKEDFSSEPAREFRPFADHDERLDTLTVQEKDCSILEEAVPGSNITLLRDNYNPGDGGTGRIIGVRISQWSRLLKNF